MALLLIEFSPHSPFLGVFNRSLSVKLGIFPISCRHWHPLQDFKKVGMACQNVCKQGKDDIIVKVNLQSLIPASFSH